MKRTMVLFMVAMFFLISGFISTVSATELNEPVKLTATELNDLQDFWDEQGIAKDVQDNLIKKIENGQVLDAADPEKIRAVDDLLNVSLENPYAEYTFPDGSKVIRSIKVIEGSKRQISPLGFTKDIEVKDVSTFIRCSFKASCYFDVDYPNSQIFSVYDENIEIYFGSFNDVSLTIPRPNETASKSAMAQLQFYYTHDIVGQPIKSGTARLTLELRHGISKVNLTVV